ncbi:peptide/nickel transport system substrate-binding protein/oligopeptide transport system substrate-binding protein [Amycolatopsis sacchari]|uniref:Peptide/nickel transport system substrate-binding protein/oligopeptide transport system substrate-binding protein n=2 Tax=Amycolatopsis sacchari TaxID=115433 RepID=A0A1I3XJ95_9PSEU|nr:peptide/nickel transport system substrate-binding protein/oligopeptide transport system substrate-binding protein [Amycolatopsis sacchari]
MRPSWRWMAAALTAVALGASACSGGGTAATGDGTFSVAVIEPDHLTPGRASGGLDIVEALFASLTELGDDGSLRYVQAESVTSQDNTTWTIKLRPGWTFHNGEPVTAHSYVDAWNATAYGPNGWANNGQLAGIAGYAELNSAQPATKELSGLKVVDDLTFTVALSKPDSQFPYQLTPAMLGFYPLPKAAFTDPEAFDRAPIGDGPFKMEGKWETGGRITTTRYDAYQGEKAKSAGVTFVIYSDTATAYTDAQAGNVDVFMVPQDKYQQVRADFPDRVVTYDAVAIDFLGLPPQDRRFADIRVRQALSMAIDRDAINKAIFAGMYRPLDSLLPDTAIGGGTDSCGRYCTFDPAAAKQLLTEAGGFSGTLELWLPAGVGYEQTFEAIANQLRQNLGLQVAVRTQPDFAQFLAALDNHTITGPYRAHWGSLYPSAQNVLTSVFTETGVGYSASYYSNPEVSALIEQGNAATPEAAAAIYHQAEARIMRDFPVIPLFSDAYVYAYGPRVSGVKVGSAELDLTGITVS